jgi:predicted metal-binding membrane protein
MAEGASARPFRLTRAPGPFMLAMVGLIGFAWAALILWEMSPYGRYLDHGQWTEVGLAGAICRALPGGRALAPMVLYVGGWLLMTAAMMLPTILPLLRRFQIMVSERADAANLLGLLVAGYLVAWIGFGLAAHGLDLGLHLAARETPWLASHGWMVGAAVLLIAGAFQFSALKYRCLDRCRTPFGFIVRRWRGLRPRLEAARIGLDHGVFCVGCCWAIMLLMFVVGTGSVGWMLLLGAVMALEKNATWGRKLSKPLGAALIGWASVIVASNTAPLGVPN